MIKANFIAIGQAGGNIGFLLENKGLNGIYINSSNEDLDTLNVENKYCIQGADGCNKNRNKAKAYIKSDVQNVLTKIRNTIDSDIVFVIGSAGGGTGSGSLPVICDVVSKLGKIVCAVSILPNEIESVQTHINTYEVIKELSQVEKLGSIFLIDNNKNAKKSVLNEKFVNLIVSLLSVVEYKSFDGNIDSAEIKNFLSKKGFCTIAKVKKENHKIFDKLKNSDVFADIENDKVISYAIISTKSNLTEKDISSNFGVALDVYKNKQNEFDFMALTGLSLPLERLKCIKNRLNKDKNEIEKNRNSVSKSFDVFNDDCDINFGYDDSYEEVEDKKTNDIDDIANDVFSFLTN